MTAFRIKKGDEVKVISGNDRGEKGKVISVLVGTGRIVVEGVNLKKKHVRPKRAGAKGEVVQIPAPLHISRVMLVCPKCGKPARVGFKVEAQKKFRICKKCGGEL